MSQQVCPQELQGSLTQTHSTYFTGFPNAMLSSYKRKKENCLRRMNQCSGHGGVPAGWLGDPPALTPILLCLPWIAVLSPLCSGHGHIYTAHSDLPTMLRHF